MLKLSTSKDIWIPVNLNTGTIKPTMTAVVTGGSKDSKNTRSIPVSAPCLQQNSQIHQKIQTENIFQSNMKTQLSQEIDKVFQQDKLYFTTETGIRQVGKDSLYVPGSHQTPSMPQIENVQNRRPLEILLLFSAWQFIRVIWELEAASEPWKVSRHVPPAVASQL